MPKKPPSNRPEINALVKLFNLGSVILGLALAGIWMDFKCHSLPLYTVIGILTGMLYSFYEAWRIHNNKEA